MFKKVLFRNSTEPKTPEEIQSLISTFRYYKPSAKVIQDSLQITKDGNAFVKNASYLLLRFGMARSGNFQDPDEREEILTEYWTRIGATLFQIRLSINNDLSNRDRYLLRIPRDVKDKLFRDIWDMAREMLPLATSSYSYGVVAVSKILFSAIPEVVLPTDNEQFKSLFRTVDIGDITKLMAEEIHLWEQETGKKLNEVDPKGKLTTLPAVYNVMAMDARTND